MSQSTNDVFPTATRLALLLDHGPLVDSARKLQGALERQGAGVRAGSKGRAHAPAGRRAHHPRRGLRRIRRVRRAWSGRRGGGVEQLTELNLGATAVGTGLNAGSDYAEAAVAQLRSLYDASAAPRRKPLPRNAEHGRCGRRTPVPYGVSRSSWERLPATCGCSAWDHARVFRRSRCLPYNRGRPSCRAR